MSEAAQVTPEDQELGRRAATCLACGAQTIGPWCHACGQKNDDCRRSISRLTAEVVQDAAALDGRFLRTCQSALMRPGRHLRQYAHGKRSPFTPPIRFFFVVITLFFLTLWAMDRNIFVLQLVPEDQAADLTGGIDFEPTAPEGMSADEARAQLEEEGIVLKTPKPQRELGEALEQARVDVATALEEGGVELPPIPLVDAPPGEEPADGDAAAADGSTEEPLAEGEEESNVRIVPYGGFFMSAQDLTYTEEEKEWLRERVGFDGSFTFLGREVTSDRVSDALIFTMQNPAAFSNALNEAVPFLMLFFVPFMALLGALFIRGKDALIYDHLLLAIQTHAFAFVLLILLLWTSAFIPGSIWFAVFVFAVPIYYTLSLRGAFHRGWVKSIVATLFVGFVYQTFFSIALFGAGVFALWEIS